MTNTNVGWLLKGLEHHSGWDSDHHITGAQLKRVHPPKSCSSGGKMEEQMEGQMEGMEANQKISGSLPTAWRQAGGQHRDSKKVIHCGNKTNPTLPFKAVIHPPTPHTHTPTPPSPKHQPAIMGAGYNAASMLQLEPVKTGSTAKRRRLRFVCLSERYVQLRP